MKTYSSCCGGPIRRRSSAVKEPLKSNPEIPKGVQLIFIGTGKISVKGKKTGTVYYASDHSRHLKVYKEDMDSFLTKKYFILKP